MSWVLAVTLLCFAVPLYVYAGYPLLLWCVARTRPEKNGTETAVPADLPSVTLIISCYNEAAVIADKLRNTLALDYPADRLSVLVVSDGSDDGTDEIVRGFCNARLRLIRQEGRLGKTMGLNLAMQQVDSEITVFSDANALYDPAAVRELVRGFSGPEVGYVVGAALYTDADSGASARNEGFYWRYELAIKMLESRVSSVVGGDGAIYAIRTHLWQPLDPKDINDFVNPLQIVAQGYRGRFVPAARCYEETAGEFGREAARKERIVNRSIRGLFRVRQVMNPMRTGLFAWQVVSHKLLRWLIPCFLALGLAGSAWLAAGGNRFFMVTALLGSLVLALALAGQLARDKNALPFWISFPCYFVVVNFYSLKGVMTALRGQTQVIWASARADSDAGAMASRERDPALLSTVAALLVLLVSAGIGYVQ